MGAVGPFHLLPTTENFLKYALILTVDSLCGLALFCNKPKNKNEHGFHGLPLSHFCGLHRFAPCFVSLSFTKVLLVDIVYR